ncbi:beta-galactosidase trimerization domain-containing protein [Catenulispora sp. MAP12-49]|uniref:beta-galactosidase trimerization domain-containing protein n=1 Tax=Catenulispora sp. MAP12-49 TaxID=3156302 RepID=UPI003516FA6E
MSIETPQNIQRFVEAGGHLLLTYQSAITDETGRVVPGGALGELTSMFGVKVDAFAPLAQETAIEYRGQRGPGSE